MRLGVLGWPVSHSRSPRMQNAALAATGLAESWRYQLLPVPAELFEETVRALPAAGFRGVNVTIPHKRAALALASEATPRATAIGAANTLLFERDGRIRADNTDAPALVQALSHHAEVRGASALVLGAGGSARAAVWALIDAGAREVLIWNRTPERAAKLAAEFGGLAVGPVGAVSVVSAVSAVSGVSAVSAVSAVSEAVPPAEFLINCTSVGLRDGGGLPDLQLHADRLGRHRVVVDFVYGEQETPLVRAARASGVAVVDGLELLIGQGALAFELFTGTPAPRAAMRSTLGLSSAP
ncbi:MAG: shikimate dehydrogenase [Acidobacteriota bacterium]|nr:shikimate dehydrogenase [Acidobacteriota bacterium]